MMNALLKNMTRGIVVASVTTALLACGRSEPENIDAQTDSPVATHYTVMGEDLQAIRDDFNANIGKIRLVFLSGPTCGICLRGMADLNDAFIAEHQNDERLVTFIAYVPTLGAREEHVAPAIPLLDGPRVHHYWEDSGIIGRYYMRTLGIEPIYAWDIWMLYGPEAVWEETLPPDPLFWQHQLGSIDKAERLDADVFARVTREHLDRLADTPMLARQSEAERYADGTMIPKVAQPRGVAIQEHIMGRGLYHNLKRINAIDMTGTIATEDTVLPLRIETSRPDFISRTVGESVATYDGNNVRYDNPNEPRGLPRELESVFLSAFEFDGPLVDWKRKGHQTQMVGMEKQGNVLAWKLDLVQSDGPHWELLINSHTGDIVKATLLDEQEQPAYLIFPSDYRESSRIRFPHRIDYQTADGELLASEVIDRVDVQMDEVKLTEVTVTH